MTTDTTVPSYWLNWRFLLCAIWITATMIFAALIIWRYEGRNNASGSRADGEGGGLHKAESWATSSKPIHPIWLLVFRVLAFSVMLAIFLADAIVNGVGVFYYYTEWTFTLVTIYFGIGSSLSILGCLSFSLEKKRDLSIAEDAERGSLVAHEDADSNTTGVILKAYNSHASLWEYSFQIIFQTCAGAVVLTDLVYWLILYPDKDDELTFLEVCMHSVNAVFLLGDTVLNSMRFPFFRIAYFALWTCVYVVFQWVIHVFVSMSWPYTFLDLSSPYAPLWYMAVGLMQIPCFGVFYLVIKIKQRILQEKDIVGA